MVGAASSPVGPPCAWGGAASIWGWSIPTPLLRPGCPELMLRKPEGVLEAGLTAWAAAPGWGNSLIANELLETAP